MQVVHTASHPDPQEAEAWTEMLHVDVDTPDGKAVTAHAARLLRSRRRYCKEDIPDQILGMVPERELLHSHSSANSVKPPIVEGIVPLNLLESSPTYVSSVALPMVDEMEPVKALS